MQHLSKVLISLVVGSLLLMGGILIGNNIKAVETTDCQKLSSAVDTLKVTLSSLLSQGKIDGDQFRIFDQQINQIKNTIDTICSSLSIDLPAPVSELANEICKERLKTGVSLNNPFCECQGDRKHKCKKMDEKLEMDKKCQEQASLIVNNYPKNDASDVITLKWANWRVADNICYFITSESHYLQNNFWFSSLSLRYIVNFDDLLHDDIAYCHDDTRCVLPFPSIGDFNYITVIRDITDADFRSLVESAMTGSTLYRNWSF